MRKSLVVQRMRATGAVLGLSLLFTSGTALHAQTPSSDAQSLQELKDRLDKLERMNQALLQKLQATTTSAPVQVAPGQALLGAQPVPGAALPSDPGGALPEPGTGTVPTVDDVIFGKTNVGCGYDSTKGFFIKALTDRADVYQGLPFELDLRGRIQTVYEYYKVTDVVNHLTGVGGNTNLAPDFGQGEAKRVRLIWQGYFGTEDLKYLVQLDGNTRGLSTQDTRANYFSNPIGNVEGGQNVSSVDAGVRLYQAYLSYDFHGEESADGYRPTYRLIAGKSRPMGALEEILGSAYSQFVDYSMANWMFDSDADSNLWQAGVHIYAFDDRLFFNAQITNGADNQVPNLNNTNLPGANIGFWWDFGGTYNEEKKKWDLYGPSVSDINWSPNPVVRVGAAANIVPMGRRSQYTTAELDFFKATSPGPGGTNVDSILNGGGLATGGTFNSSVASGNSPFAVDAFDAYTFDFFLTGHYHGWSVYNEWWVRDMNNFRGEKFGGVGQPILYTMNTPTGSTATALFNRNALIDYGSAFQAGYFLIPKKLELAFRYDFITGESGDINGNGTFSTVSSTAVGIKQSGLVNGAQPTGTVPTGTNIRIVNGAFTHDHTSQEFTVGLNFLLYGEQVKWQTDVGFYTGGNPATNGQGAAGFLPGVDGYLVRTQIQLYF